MADIPKPIWTSNGQTVLYRHGDVEQIVADNAALRAELANARAVDIHSCHAGCTRAGCVNARLREDAERYRWLTSGEHGSKRDDWIWDCVLTEDQRKGHNDIDAAIDAARKATP